MIPVPYVWAKLMLKIRGKAIANSRISSSATINADSQVVNSAIGKYSYCGYDCKIINCELDNYYSLADNVVIGSAQHSLQWFSTSPVFEDVKSSPRKRLVRFKLPKAKQTNIGSDMWIGHGAIIKAGVNVGHGAVMGAGAVVTKDVEPYAVVGGCPAKVLKYRFSEEIRSQLLATSWWEMNDQEMMSVAEYIVEPNLFIQKCNESGHPAEEIKCYILNCYAVGCLSASPERRMYA